MKPDPANCNFKLITIVPGARWPAITPGTGAGVLSLLWQMEQSEWMPAAVIRQQQFRQLNLLLQHAFRHSSYHRQHLGESGYDDSQTLDEDHWSAIPVLTRHALQQYPEQIRCTSYPESHGKLAELSSSGSTGRPVMVYRTTLTKAFYDAHTLRDHLWHKRDFLGRVATIRYVKEEDKAHYPEGEHFNGWGHGVNPIFQTGDAWLLRIDTPLDKQAEWLSRIQPDYLLTYPTNIRALINEFKKQKISLTNLRQISTISEPLGKETQQTCEDYFKVPVIDMYSCQEIGLLASRCPDSDNYHVHAEHVLVEILDEKNEPCSVGESGRVVLTDLHNFAMPLIRYEVGDYAEAGGACSCGRGLPVINKILGRQRNLLTLPSGEQMWPVFGMMKYSELTGRDIRQVQLIQKDLQNLELKLVMNGTLSINQADKVIKLIRDSVHHRFDIEISYCDDIPRSKSGKYEDFLSLI